MVGYDGLAGKEKCIAWYAPLFGYEGNEYVKSFLIKTITDGSGRKYRFSYDADYRLTSIQVFDSNGNAVKVKDNNGNSVDLKYVYEFSEQGEKVQLTSVTYPDGESVSYIYTDDGITAKNIDGRALEYKNPKNGSITLISSSAELNFISSPISLNSYF